MNVGGAIGAFVAGAAALHAYTVVRDWAAHCEAAPATPAVPPPAADLVVVTGASRGLGQAVAVALAAAHPEATGRGATGRVMVLTARTASGLDTTAKMVEKAGGGTVGRAHPSHPPRSSSSSGTSACHVLACTPACCVAWYLVCGCGCGVGVGAPVDPRAPCSTLC
jgi:hypothetical protein